MNSVLSEYAGRGVFRSFSEVASRPGRAEFRFHWLFNLPFHVVFDEARRELSFRKLLPGIGKGTPIESELRAYLADLSSADRLEHRRLDTTRMTVRLSQQRGTAAISFQILDRDYDYGVRRAINLVNEVLLDFLNVRFPEYMIEQFKLPDE